MRGATSTERRVCISGCKLVSCKNVSARFRSSFNVCLTYARSNRIDKTALYLSRNGAYM